jgi:hypothetical protein
MKINPAQYQCPQHHTDLTDLVQEQLDADVPPVAYKRGPLLGRKPPPPQPFEVIVTCPGAETPHDQTCIGTYTP